MQDLTGLDDHDTLFFFGNTGKERRHTFEAIAKFETQQGRNLSHLTELTIHVNGVIEIGVKGLDGYLLDLPHRVFGAQP